jgi:hypothetical protein
MSARARALEALSQTPPDVEGARALLREADERAMTPDALTLRAALLEAASWMETGRASRPSDLISFLRDAANGRLVELDDHDIDFDVPDEAPGPLARILAGVPFSPRPGAPSMPGPDGALLEAVRVRDALVARRIAGDTPSDQDMETYRNALVALGRALLPLVDAGNTDASPEGL